MQPCAHAQNLGWELSLDILMSGRCLGQHLQDNGRFKASSGALAGMGMKGSDSKEAAPSAQGCGGQPRMLFASIGALRRQRRRS